MTLKPEILDLSRQNDQGALSSWFDSELDRQIGAGYFATPDKLNYIKSSIISDLANYRESTGVNVAVLGMSGGVDSGASAALLREAGWRVIGHTMPIDQDPAETARGIEACRALEVEHEHVELTDEYHIMVHRMGLLDNSIKNTEEKAVRVRRGNIRARLRMMTLYDQAHRHGGLVISTDNFSELGAGFWTLHGDVGDLSPIQALLKSWEVPWIARAVGVPESVWRAKPTDGLGIDDGDEAQIGASYLQWDIMVNYLVDLGHEEDIAAKTKLSDDPDALRILDTVMARIGGSWFKRMNPVCISHPLFDRYKALEALDRRHFVPKFLNN